MTDFVKECPRCNRQVRAYLRIPVEYMRLCCPDCDHEWGEMQTYRLPLDLPKAETEFAQTLTEVALDQAGGVIERAGRLLGMQRSTLRARMVKWGWHWIIPHLEKPE